MADCEKVRTVAYVVGNPWPICHDCRRHVYMIEATGEWRHFPGVGMPDCPWCGEPLAPADDCEGRCVNGHEWWDEKPAAEELRRTYGIPCHYDHSEDGRLSRDD